jgi:hypothetical protein
MCATVCNTCAENEDKGVFFGDGTENGITNVGFAGLAGLDGKRTSRSLSFSAMITSISPRKNRPNARCVSAILLSMHSVSYTIVFAYSCKHRHVFSLSRSAFWTFRFAFEDTYWPSVGSCISKDADFFFVVFAFVPQRRTLSSGNARYFSMMFSSSSKEEEEEEDAKNVRRLFRPPLLADG